MNNPVEVNLNGFLTPQAIARRRLYQHKGFIIGAIGLAIVLVMALFAPLLAPYDP
jgi:peptide/nickel transport system permease protein